MVVCGALMVDAHAIFGDGGGQRRGNVGPQSILPSHAKTCDGIDAQGKRSRRRSQALCGPAGGLPTGIVRKSLLASCGRPRSGTPAGRIAWRLARSGSRAEEAPPVAAETRLHERRTPADGMPGAHCPGGATSVAWLPRVHIPETPRRAVAARRIACQQSRQRPRLHGFANGTAPRMGFWTTAFAPPPHGT